MFQAQSVAGVVFSKDKKSVLLIQRRDVPVWVLPGGGVEKEEDFKTAIEREFFEETGFFVKTKKVVGYYHPINRLSKKTIVFECSIIYGEPNTSDETRAVQFFNLDQLPIMPPPYPEWIQEARLNQLPVERKLQSVNYLTLLKYAIKHPILVFRFILARLGLPWNT